MNRDAELDRLVRHTLAGLAAEARPVPLAAAAVLRAKRIRRRRLAAAAGATAILLAALVIPLNRDRDRDDQPAPPRPTPPASPSASPSAVPFAVSEAPPTLRPVELPGGFTLVAVPGPRDSTWVYDRTAGGYVTVPFPDVRPAPAGDLALALSARTGFAVLLDLGAHTVRDLPLATVPRQLSWSPDGRSLLYSDPSAGRLTIIEVNAGQVKARALPFDAAAHHCVNGDCPAAWTRTGQEVAVTSPDGKGLSLLSAEDGHLVRTVPVSGPVEDACGWSTDGRHAVTDWRIVDTATGATTAELPGSRPASYSLCWSSPTDLLLSVPGEVQVYSPTGTLRETIPTTTGAPDGNHRVEIGPS
ncbi:hypothetical protein KZZ52_56170 [Dactylosporangium sp. AC04546]|uniref:hypothetical protein n=1 Tax=Dactylosporangium sp. AC04546 TaxID=2862460 RepID=UPI001EE0FF73|nr:hypothetical protein [Dactylosporangium sp. AC04546]WVK83156.1 hypothetical protein KZZ52_56170 [Dactylosporangium sp. AC04546]